jgi:lipoprotein-releasing system permease protein|tara:strand:- start:254 stop:1369 length:1116 start_codon:yes stop_codon:yes gene_type:complete
MTWVSLLGLSLGVIALIVVVSVMNGFDSELKRRILGVVPHVQVQGVNIDELQRTPGVEAVARFASLSGLLVKGSDSQLVQLHGIEPDREAEMSILPEHMVYGAISLLKDGGIVLGQPLAYRLGLRPGDGVTILLPVLSEQQTVRTHVLNVNLIGTFELNSELDYGLGLLDLKTLSPALGTRELGYRLRLDDIFKAPATSEHFAAMPGVVVSDWSAQYGDFFRTVKMEKVMMFLLLTVIVGIAGFSIVSSLSMLVKEKQFDIAVLRTCGLSSRGITMIFIIQGGVVGLLGVLLGVTLGLPLAHHITVVVSSLESLFGGRILAGTYFDSIPSDVRYLDVLIIVLVSLVISLVATIYPAIKAAGVRPAEVLRYE